MDHYSLVICNLLTPYFIVKIKKNSCEVNIWFFNYLKIVFLCHLYLDCTASLILGGVFFKELSLKPCPSSITSCAASFLQILMSASTPWGGAMGFEIGTPLSLVAACRLSEVYFDSIILSVLLNYFTDFNWTFSCFINNLLVFEFLLGFYLIKLFKFETYFFLFRIPQVWN